MKTLYCSQYDDVDCCKTCHHEDQFYKMPYKQYQIVHCCSSYHDIISDINKHTEEPLENGCED